MNFSNIKTSIVNNRKYLLMYIVLVAIFTLAMFSVKNYQYWGFEAISIPIITIIGLIAILYSFENEIELHKTALILILLFGLITLFLAPPFTYPDEAIHFTRAELLSEGVLYPVKTDQGFYVNDYFFELNQAQKGLTIFDNPAVNTPITNSKAYIPVTTESPFYSYIPSMLGILLSKVLNLTAIFALLFARLGNLILYAGVSYYAIKKAPKFKTALTVIATMPLVIAQVTSTSYDAFILTFTMVILAYFIKMYADKVENKDLAIFFISVLLISLIKPPYIMLSLLVLLVPEDSFKQNRNYSLIAIALVFIATFLSVGGLLNSIFSSATTSSIASAGNISLTGQVNYILANPLAIFGLVKYCITSIPSVFISDLSFYHYADFKGLKLVNLAYFVFFILFSIFYKQEINLSKIKRIILLIICLITYFGIFAILYLQWTPVGSDIILGIQARYFIPIIALLPLIINYDLKSIEKYKYLMMAIVFFMTSLLLLTITHYY